MLAMLLFQAMDAMAKWLVKADISAVQVIAVRSWMMLAMILLVLALRGKLSLLRTQKPSTHALRGLLAFFAPFFYFTALKDLPLADATVIFFSATFILTAASALFFGERVGWHRWGAVAVGFVGVIVAMNPQGGGDITGYLMVLVATSIYAILFLVGKHLSREDSVIALVFWINLGMGVVASAALPWYWVDMSTGILFKLFLMTAVALAAHYALTAAFSRAEVSAIAPFEYSALIWAALLGYLIWLEIPSTNLWIGAGIIVCSGIYVIHRESLAARPAA